MEPRLIFDERSYKSPFPVGDGPFRIKGTAYRGIVEWANAIIPGGLAAACAPLDHATSRYLQQSFLAASYYDYLPVFSMYIVAADLCNKPLVEMVRGVARHVAERDVKGIYRFLVRRTSPEFLVGRFANAWKQYFNFGGLVANLVAPNVCEVRAFGFPTIAAEPFAAVLEGWSAAAMENVGVKTGVFRRNFEPAGEAHGIPISNIDLRFRWTREDARRAEPQRQASSG